jgi:predicted AAA+ superfamily ATPase
MDRPGPYRPRLVDGELDELSVALGAIAIEGAKAVGKTATALQRASSAHQLDDPDQRALAEADLDRLLETPPPILIDEWQYVPAVWDRVRRAIDADPSPGRFLLTGSASPRNTGTHSGGGRIVSVRMRPLSLAERLDEPPSVSLASLLEGGRPPVEGTTRMRVANYTDEILRSGFPGLRHLDGRPLRAALDGYIQRIVDRDFPELGHPIRNRDGLLRWMTAYAAASSTTATFEKIRDAASAGHRNPPTRATVLPYREVLERLFILDSVSGWKPARNPIAELALPPKHQLADPALAARLLGASSSSLLQGEAAGPVMPRDGTLLGALFESLVTQSVRVYAQASEARVGHLRTHRGSHEVDLIVERADGRVVGIEVKLTATPPDDAARHLRWLEAHLEDDLLDSLIITTGSAAYRREDGIAVVPAALLGA